MRRAVACALHNPVIAVQFQPGALTSQAAFHWASEALFLDLKHRVRVASPHFRISTIDAE
jgi:hypothetical protein